MSTWNKKGEYVAGVGNVMTEVQPRYLDEPESLVDVLTNRLKQLMTVILEVEVKLNYNGTLEYMTEEVYGPYSADEAQSKYEELVNTTISRGYYDKVESRNSNRTRLSNGGTATKYFILKTLK